MPFGPKNCPPPLSGSKQSARARRRKEAPAEVTDGWWRRRKRVSTTTRKLSEDKSFGNGVGNPISLSLLLSWRGNYARKALSLSLSLAARPARSLAHSQRNKHDDYDSSCKRRPLKEKNTTQHNKALTPLTATTLPSTAVPHTNLLAGLAPDADLEVHHAAAVLPAGGARGHLRGAFERGGGRWEEGERTGGKRGW